MKKLGWVMLLCLCMIAAVAHADYDPKQAAIGSLTEVYGYTVEEADAFCFEDDGVQKLIFYQPGHPEWAYTLTYNAQESVNWESPFHSGHSSYPGENNIRWFLRQVQEGQWFTQWNEENRSAAQAALANCDISPDRQLVIALAKNNVATDQLIQAFFTSCYGTELNWPKAVFGWRDELLDQYGVTLSMMTDVPGKGIVEYIIPHGINYIETKVCEFKGEVPEDLQAVFQAEPHLNGWTCLTGIMFTVPEQTLSANSGYAVAAFEKNGQRLLVGLDQAKGQWSVYPIGTNALYQDASLELSITGASSNGQACIIRYDGAEGMQAFTISINNPTDNVRGHYFMCRVKSYEAISSDGADRVSIHCDHIRTDQWDYTEQHDDATVSETVATYYPVWMGVLDIADFPRSIALAKTTASPIPEGYVIAGDVHLRKDHSSRASDLGTLQSGTLLPVLDIVPGDPYPWIMTSIGQMKGYVCAEYTSAGNERNVNIAYDYPMPVAVAEQPVDLKSGTGWFDGTKQKLSEGTRMRVIMEKDNWLYVVVPRAEYNNTWLMDVNGAYGYVKKSDVTIGALEIQLEWQ